MRSPRILLAVALIACAASPPPGPPDAFGETPVRAFVIEKEVVVGAPPEEAFDAFTGDVSGWWDHRFSETEPVRFEIEPRPGGRFLEIFDERGDGLVHAQVTWADRGERLVFRGPLGAHGMAIDLVHDFTFAAHEDGTRLHATISGLGAVTEQQVAGFDAVWDHFLAGRFVPYVASGGHRDR